MIFSETVKKIRNDSHLTQQAFAEALGVSFATINRWENKQQKPSKLALRILDDYCRDNGIEILIDQQR